MKRLLLAGIAVGVLSTTAFAADLGSRRSQRYQAAPIEQTVMMGYNWTGFYAGAHLGYGWATNKVDFPNPFDTKPSGVNVGGQIGYNYQMGQAVVGGEADIGYLGRSISKSFINGFGTQANVSRNNGYIGTLRARLGFVPVERLLIYGTGGLAFGSADSASQVISSMGGIWSGKTSGSQVGWTAGAGAEFAVTNSISIKGEYLYYDLGSSNTTLSALNAAAAGILPVARFDNKGHLLRVGINYKF